MSSDKKILKQIENIILSHRKYIFFPPVNQRIVMLLSGGLDSTICVAKIIEEWNCIVYPLFVRRHHRSTKYEEKAIDLISKEYIKKYPDNFIKPKKIDIVLPPAEFKIEPKLRYKKMGHEPLRNMCFNALGVQYAIWLNYNQNFDIKTIFIATTGDDFLPNCSIQSYRVSTIMACVDQNDWTWQITSPFIEPYLKDIPFYKRDNILWAAKNKLPLQHTRTCINDCEIADGTCIECKIRIKAFKEAGIKDPIAYQV